MNKLIRSLLITLFAVCLSIIGNVLVMVYGWGCSPKSWLFIVGVGTVMPMMVQAILAAAKGDDK